MRTFGKVLDNVMSKGIYEVMLEEVDDPDYFDPDFPDLRYHKILKLYYRRMHQDPSPKVPHIIMPCDECPYKYSLPKRLWKVIWKVMR